MRKQRREEMQIFKDLLMAEFDKWSALYLNTFTTEKNEQKAMEFISTIAKLYTMYSEELNRGDK